MLKRHDEKEYLELEQKFIGLFNAVSSLLVITEGENLESDSQKIIHFNALCQRISQIIEHYDTYKGSLSIQGQSDQDPAHTGSPSSWVIIADKKEREMIIEALFNMACMYHSNFDSLAFDKLAKQIQGVNNDTKTINNYNHNYGDMVRCLLYKGSIVTTCFQNKNNFAKLSRDFF